MKDLTLQNIDTNRISKLIWAVNLCSISASTLSYIYLSYYIYRVTGNIFLSQTVLFSPMILPVICVNQIHRISDRFPPRSLLLFINAIALLGCVFVYGLLPQFPLIAILGGVFIGTLDAVQRVGRIVAIKYYFSSDNVETTVPLTLTAQFIAGGLAGAVMSSFRGEMTPIVTLVISVILFGTAAVAAFMLPILPWSIKTKGDKRLALMPEFCRLLHINPLLKRSFWTFILFISFFQGFFNVSRVTLPAHVLHLSESYVGLLQVVNSMAALVGALTYYKCNKRGIKFPPFLMAIISAIFMVTSAWGINTIVSYNAYFVYIFFFELMFFKVQSDIVIHSEPGTMPLIASVQYAGVYAGMIITIIIGSLLVEYIDLRLVAILFCGIYFLLLNIFIGKVKINK